MNIHLDQDYIRVIDGAVSAELCESIIKLFESDSVRHHHDGDRYIELDIFARRTGISWLPGRITEWKPIADELVSIVNSLMAEYVQHWDPLAMLPKQYAMEGMRVKAYRVNTHEFRLHVDQGNRESAARFLSFLLYLNDNTAGTEFIRPPVTVEARQGRVVIFPPNWQYPHIGQMPRDTDKYILSTYLHYKD